MRFAAMVGVGLLVCCAAHSRTLERSTRYVLSAPDPKERCVAVLFRTDDGCSGSASSTLDGHGAEFTARCPDTALACGALVDCRCGLVDAGALRLNFYVYRDCGDPGDAGPFAHFVDVTTEVDAGLFEVCKRREAYELGDWPDE